MRVPFNDLSRLTLKIKDPVFADWNNCFDCCSFIGGEPVRKFENEMGSYLKVNHFVSCANGTDALLISLQAAGIRPGMRVAMPNLTFWATFEAIAQLGAVPILVDIDPEDLQMSFESFKNAFNKIGFQAAVLVHLFGWCSGRLEEYRFFCKTKKVLLIEDSAQAFGVRYNEKSVFSDAQIATLSFYPSKVFGGVMDGGAIVTKDGDIAEKIRMLGNHGRSQHYSYSEVGWNSRMSSLQAVYLTHLLPLADSILRDRRQTLQFYHELVRLHLFEKIKFFDAPPGVAGNGYLFVSTLQGEIGFEVERLLRLAGIESNRIYPQTIAEQAPAKHAFRFSGLENSRNFCQEVINLPLFYGITNEECTASVSALSNILSSGTESRYAQNR